MEGAVPALYLLESVPILPQKCHRPSDGAQRRGLVEFNAKNLREGPSGHYVGDYSVFRTLDVEFQYVNCVVSDLSGNDVKRAPVSFEEGVRSLQIER